MTRAATVASGRAQPGSGSRSSTNFVAVLFAVAIAAGCYVLGTPRHGGPDEPAHAVRSAAIVRLQFSGASDEVDRRAEVFEVPEMVGSPNPQCWAFQPAQPAGCATIDGVGTDDVPTPSSADDYAPWSYVLPGLASFVPWVSGYHYLARSLMAVLPVLLVASALVRARRRGRLAATAVFLGTTPIVWFSMTIVNPSALAVAGGLALWVAWIVPSTRRHDVLLALAWAAVLLPRRDGPLWATLIVLTVWAAAGTTPRDRWASASPAVRGALVVAAVAAPLTSLALTGVSPNLLISFAPVSIVVITVAAEWWAAPRTPRERVVAATGSAVIAIVMILVGFAVAPGNFDTEDLRLVAGSTGEHLRQLVGVLGWLDTPVPLAAVIVFWAAFGGVVAVVFLENRRAAVAGMAAVVGLVVVAWILELAQGSASAYWQGRYSMPFFSGVAFVMCSALDRDRSTTAGSPADGLAPLIAASAWLVGALGFAAALQRWGVGVLGTWVPTRWDTYGAPIPPALLLFVYVLATGWLAAASSRRSSDQPAPTP